MKSTFISKEKNEAKFTMEFTAEEFEKAIIEAYQETKGNFAIDGFRKGKAPRKLIESHYGEDVFFEEAINNMFSQNYPKAIDELELNVVDRPSAEFSEIAKGKDITVTIKVMVYPEIEVKDYKEVQIEKVEATVDEDAVEREIASLQKRNSRMVLVERPAQNGDTVLIDYSGFVGDNQFEGGTAERYPLKLGSNSFIPGFEDQLVGASVGEDRDVKVTFPEEYHAEDLAGKEAIFKCKIHEIKEEELPELNDDFAKDISEYDTLDELKKETKTNLEKAATAEAESKMKNAVVEKVVEGNEVDIPQAMIEDEIDNMMREFDQQLRYQGLDLQKYFEYLQKDPMVFRNEIRDDATKKVKTRIVVGSVVKAENIEVTAEEIDKEVELMAIQYKMEAEKIKEMLGVENLQYLAQDIKMRKAVDFMYDAAKIK